MSFLTEAFKELVLVESEDFSLDKKGVEKLKDFMENDAIEDEDFITVIDKDFDDGDDMDTANGVHVGMTILGCEICNALHYEDSDKVEIDEEQQLANVGVACPHCYSTDGFKIIGTVAPFEDISVSVESEDGEESTDDIDVKVDGKDVEITTNDNSDEEGGKKEDKKGVNESLDSWITARKLKKAVDELPKKEFKNEEEKQNYQKYIDNLKKRAKHGAVEYDKDLGRNDNATQKILNKVDKVETTRAAKKQKRAEFAKKIGVSEDELKQLANDAGFTLKEDLGSWLAAKKLQRMQKKGPKNGEDLEARQKEINRLTDIANGELSNNPNSATKKVMAKTDKIVKDRADAEKKAQEKLAAKKKAIEDLISRTGAKNEDDLVAKMAECGYVVESLKLESPYLDTRFDRRKSFYNKARINDTNDVLYSYETKVMEMVDGKPVLTVGENLLSQTTLRHIKEWLKQKGFPAESKQQILRDYSNKVEEALNESPMVDLSDEEYEKVMKDREANKSTNNNISIGNRGANLLTTLKNNKTAQEQRLLSILKQKQEEEKSLQKQVQSLKQRAGDMIYLVDSCHEQGIKIQNWDPVFQSYEIYMNGKWWAFSTDSRDMYIVNGKKYRKYNDNTSRVGIPLCQLSADGRVWSQWGDDKIDDRIKAYKDFLNEFDKFEDGFYNDIEKLSNSFLDESLKEIVSKKIVSLRESKESLKNRLNKKSLKEGKKVKSTDDLTDDDIFDLVYNQLVYSGERSDLDTDGNTKNSGTVLKGFYSENQAGVGTNSSGIDCIKIVTKSDRGLQPAIQVAKYYDCLYEVTKDRDGHSVILIDYGSGDLEKLLADKGKPFALKKKGEDLEKSQVHGTFKSPQPAQTGLKKNGKLDLSKTKAGDPNKSEILVEGDKTLKEGMEDISITTGEEVIKIKATPRTDKETIIPPVEEPVETEEQPVEEEPIEGEDTEMEIEDIDEVGIDELGESYLKRVYDNVSSFKTTNGSINGNKIILEGIIGFKSGKKAKTSFILEAKEMTKRGRVRFTGMNENISKNKSAYTITGKVVNKKFIAESFNYNYLGKDSTTGKTKKLYGTIRKSK